MTRRADKTATTARAPDPTLRRYLLRFALVVAPAYALLTLLANWRPETVYLQRIGMFTAVFVAAEVARRAHARDAGRTLKRSERKRFLLWSLAVLVIVIAVVGMVTLKIGMERAHVETPISPLIMLFFAPIFAALLTPFLWLSYYWLNDRDAARASAAAQPPTAPPAPPASPIRVLVLGSGGREHALAWKLAQSSRVAEVLVAPGNAGTARESKCRNVPCDLTDNDAVLQLARREDVQLTVVGPEAPLVNGVVDRFRGEGLRIFGPTAAAAQLEGSKAFAKDFLQRHGIPTAHYAVHDDVDAALAYIRGKGAPIVIKADGLAAGKGVIVAMTLPEAEAAVRDMLAGNVVGNAGSRVVIEEFLDGEEASFISVVDGTTALPMATSQDHKRVGDGDTGPNTGGMGAYSPAPVVTPEVHTRVMREIVQPTVAGMAKDGIPFTGFLYAGLMIDAGGAPKVIEFNVRFGDPETQPVMLRLQSDLLDVLELAIDARLQDAAPRWNPQPSLGVVMAAERYPDTPARGDVITGLDSHQPSGTKVFHAGTTLDAQGNIVTAGGRVLCVCALGNTVAEAQLAAYAAVDGIHWRGEFHRSDIGWRAIARAPH